MPFGIISNQNLDLWIIATRVKGRARRLDEALELGGQPVLSVLFPLSCSAHSLFTRAYIFSRLLQLLVLRHMEYSLSEPFPKSVGSWGLMEGVSKILGHSLLSEIADPSRGVSQDFVVYLTVFCWFETAKAAATKYRALALRDRKQPDPRYFLHWRHLATFIN